MPVPRKSTPDEIAALRPEYEEAVGKARQERIAKKESRVTGIDIGYLYEDGTRTDKIGVRTHLLPVAGDGTSDATARSGGGAAAGASLIATYSRGTPSLVQNVLPSHPVRPGVSVSSERSRGGTIGLIVFDKVSGQPFVLSCHHVLRSENEAELAIQPAIYLGGTPLDPQHLLGRVRRFIDDSDGDAAIASIDNRDWNRHQFRSQVLIESADMPSIGDEVEKDGMGTRVRCGFVDGIGQYYMGEGNDPMEGFRIVRGSPDGPCGDDLSQHADSGSIWYRKSDNKGLGLHVGGDISVTNANIRPAIACFLTRVLERLDVRIPPQRPPNGDADLSAEASVPN